MADNETVQELEKVAEAAGNVAQAVNSARGTPQTLDFILDVTLQVTVEVGRARMTIQDLLQLGQGSVVELEKLAGEPLDVYINGKPVARGEAVIVNEKFGVRLTDIISPDDRVDALA
ncbi:MAG: flagellar motor switch protein FliN [SAR324 cluster bacterium]|uniref:Flagellar motor switch protein FliN n=1 Tax=SAR324 cluster bacterium TaxID=2024889 RepID=A0A7X9FR47_9DELT|nr:flagellar motor switch protein FliN [SAR324 cluster bacterium]